MPALKILKAACLLLVLLMLVFPGVSSALSQDQLNVFDSGINYYDVAGSGSAGACATILPGSDNPTKIWDFFAGKGLGAQQIAAIMGNWEVESGFNPTAYDINGQATTTDNPVPANAFGIAQWRGGRQTSLQQYANGQNLPITDLGAQLNFAWQELNGSYKSSVLDPINSTNDLSSMVHIINMFYEVSGAPDGPRFSDATSVLSQYGSAAGAQGTGSSITCTGSGGTPVSAAGYQDPFHGCSVTSERVDQGVDYAGTCSVYPAGNATIDRIITHDTGWIKSDPENFVSYTLIDGSAKGLTIYVAEDCTPYAGISEGDSVTPNTPICSMFNGNLGIEMGWAQKGTDVPVAQQIEPGCYTPDGIATQAGLNFSDFMKTINGPAGDTSRSTDWPATACQLPSGWPTWPG